jgi:hypothetical protein
MVEIILHQLREPLPGGPDRIAPGRVRAAMIAAREPLADILENRSFHGAYHHADRDVRCRLGQPVAALHAALAFHEAGTLESQQYLVHVSAGNFLQSLNLIRVQGSAFGRLGKLNQDAGSVFDRR